MTGATGAAATVAVTVATVAVRAAAIEAEAKMTGGGHEVATRVMALVPHQLRVVNALAFS